MSKTNYKQLWKREKEHHKITNRKYAETIVIIRKLIHDDMTIDELKAIYKMKGNNDLQSE